MQSDLIQRTITNLGLIMKRLYLRVNICYLLYGLIFIFFGIAIVFQKPNVDAVYYLNVSQLLAKGFLPWRDIATPYPYVSFLLLTPLAALIPGPYLFASGLFVSVLLLSVAARFVYLIGCCFFCEKKIAHISVFVFLVSVYAYEGTMYVLEPFVLFWGLPAIWCVLRSNGRTMWLLSSGVLCGLAMFTKQYALGFLPLCFLSVLLCCRPITGWGGDWYRNMTAMCRQFGWITVGFAGVVLVYFFMAFFLGGLAVFKGFVNQSYNHTFVKGSILVSTLKLFLATSGFIFLPLVFFYRIEVRLKLFFLLCFCGIFGFSLALYFAPYAHYLILLTPFSALLFGGICLLARNGTFRFRLSIGVFFAPFVSILLFCLLITATRLVYYRTSDTTMVVVSRKLNAVIPPRETTLFLPNPVLDYNPILLYAGLVSPLVPIKPAWPTRVLDLDQMENVQLINADNILFSRNHLTTVNQDPFRRNYLQTNFAENKSFSDEKFILLSRIVAVD